MIKTQFGKSIKHLNSDNGREYVNHDMSKFLSEKFCCSRIHMYGYATTKCHCWRKNRHLLEVIQTLFFFFFKCMSLNLIGTSLSPLLPILLIDYPLGS